MYYVHLGNKGFATPDNANPVSWVEQPGWGLTNTGPFANLLPSWHWTGQPLWSSGAWFFDFQYGRQEYDGQKFGSRAWAVHPGDLLIPVPAALPLFVSAVAVVLARPGRR
jgi:hypothetical protein